MVLSYSSASEKINYHFNGHFTDALEETVLFDWSMNIIKKGSLIKFRSEYRETGNDKLHTVESYVTNNGVFYDYEYERKNIRESAKVSLRNNSLFYTKSINGNEQYKTEPFPENFVVGAGLFVFIENNRNKLLRNQKITINFGIPEFMKTISFKLQLDNTVSKQNHYIIRMAPSNFIYRFFSESAFFVFNKPGGFPKKVYSIILPVLGNENNFKRFKGVFIHKPTVRFQSILKRLQLDTTEVK